jgi:hypothetical protein
MVAQVVLAVEGSLACAAKVVLVVLHYEEGSLASSPLVLPLEHWDDQMLEMPPNPAHSMIAHARISPWR